MQKSAYLWFLFTCFSLAGCKKNVPEGVAPEIFSLVFNHGAVSTLNKDQREINVSISDYIDRKKLIAIFQVTDGATASVNGVTQQSSETANDFTLPVVYQVTKNGQSSQWTVRLQSNSNSIGLGTTVTAQARLVREYEWYETQDTAKTNSAPVCVSMALNWAGKLQFIGANPKGVVAFAASKGLLTSQGLSQAPVIAKVLTSYGVNWKFVNLTDDHTEITEAIDHGYLVMLQLNMGAIPINQAPAQHTNRFFQELPVYPSHCILVKGYMKVDGNLYYETYDPYTAGRNYTTTGEPLGRNRYYLATDADKAVYGLFGLRYALVIHEQKGNGNPGNGTFEGTIKNEISAAQLSYILNPANLYDFAVASF